MATSRPAALELADVPFTDPWTTVDRAADLVSPRVGLIGSVHQSAFRSQDPVSLAMGVTVPDLAAYSEIENAPKAGGGGEDVATALAATIGEAVERYAMLLYDKDEMVLAPWREVAADAVEPRLVRYYSPEQVANRRPGVQLFDFDEDTPIRWAWGWSLTEERPRLVPATQVYLQYKLDDDEGSAGRNASSGLAAGLTLEEAILSGLLEVVERDAFTISWHHRRAGRRVVVDDPELLGFLRRRFQVDHPAVELRLFDISLDIPLPTLFGVMRRPAEYGRPVCVSTVTRTSPRRAFVKCMREIGQGLSYLRFLDHQLRDWEPADDFSDLSTFDHHCTLYLRRPELADRALAFLDEEVPEVRLDDLPDHSAERPLTEVERCVALLAERGYETIVVDITPEEVRDVGFRVVRVLVPGLVPLHGNHGYPYLGLERLEELPRRLGWVDDGAPLPPRNPYPHPFP